SSSSKWGRLAAAHANAPLGKAGGARNSVVPIGSGPRAGLAGRRFVHSDVLDARGVNDSGAIG
ncbi:MAG: hypothetical protein VX584_05775, partial [Actinomycetota bacterium]|nr:hypothetical protein [Actinomycetota bacterium]